MKTKHFKKTITLNKWTVSNLDTVDMLHIKAGEGTRRSSCVSLVVYVASCNCQNEPTAKLIVSD